MGLLFPLRLAFYHYLSHYWIGAFGILTVVILSLLYLSKKKKLGFFGTALLNTLERRTKNKSFKIAVGTSIFVIYLSSLAIAGNVFASETIYTNTVTQLKTEGITDAKTLDKYNQSHPSHLTFIQWLQGLLLVATPNEGSFVIFKVTNDFMDGWPLAFFTIMLVEELEFLGMLFYLKYGGHKLR